MKLNEEIDTGQVLSAQDIADRRRERESVDNLPEVQALRRKVRQMRINMDNYPEGSKEEAELISQIKATNQQIQKYYQQANQLRSQYGFNQPKRETIKMNEQQLRNLIAESVNNVLNEIGDTPAGQWMLGRLAGRQQNRVSGSQFSKQGRIQNTTTNAKDYLPQNTYSFGKGYDLENNDWMEDEYSNGYYDHNTHEYNMSQMDMNQAYGDAMGDMIRYSADKNKLKKKVAESVKKSLKENVVKSGNLSNQLGDIRLMAKYLQSLSFQMSDTDKDALYERVFPIMRELWNVAKSYGY